MRFTTLLSCALCFTPALATAQSDALPHSRGNLIYAAASNNADASETVLELIKRRLNLVITDGYYRTDTGLVTTCIMQRRNLWRMQSQSGELRHCEMISVFVDRGQVSDPGSYLRALRLANVESIELMAMPDARSAYGLSAIGSEVLVIWTRGRGPFSRE